MPKNIHRRGGVINSGIKSGTKIYEINNASKFELVAAQKPRKNNPTIIGWLSLSNGELIGYAYSGYPTQTVLYSPKKNKQLRKIAELNGYLTPFTKSSDTILFASPTTIYSVKSNTTKKLFKNTDSGCDEWIENAFMHGNTLYIDLEISEDAAGCSGQLFEVQL